MLDAAGLRFWGDMQKAARARDAKESVAVVPANPK